MEQLFIAGAGGFGREVYAWASDTFEGKRIAFLDDNPQAGQDPKLPAPVVSTLAAYEPQPGDALLCAVGNPQLRECISQDWLAKGGRLATLVHPTAVVAPSAQLADGVLICPLALVSADARVETGAAVYYHSSIDHDVEVGPWCQITAHCDVTGAARLGKRVFLGSHASVLPSVSIGDDVVVGAGAVVNRDVSAGQTVVGVPARAINSGS